MADTLKRNALGAVPWVLLMGSLALAGCPTGDGEGRVSGQFYVLGCDGAYNFGSRTTPAAYDMRADFFVGEPQIDPTEVAPKNRLDLRIQRGGNNVEDADSLYLQISDVKQVARQFAASQGTPVGPASTVRASLLLYVTCPTFFGSLEATYHAAQTACPSLDATTVDTLCNQMDYNESFAPDLAPAPFAPEHSCILFCQLGAAKRGEPVPDDFEVDFGDTVRGIFHLTLSESRLLQSGVEICADGIDNDGDGETDEEECALSSGFGRLVGKFNFEVRRGQVAQEFP